MGGGSFMLRSARSPTSTFPASKTRNFPPSPWGTRSPIARQSSCQLAYTGRALGRWNLVFDPTACAARQGRPHLWIHLEQVDLRGEPSRDASAVSLLYDPQREADRCLKSSTHKLCMQQSGNSATTVSFSKLLHHPIGTPLGSTEDRFS